MEHIGKHMRTPSAQSKKDKATERGELMKYFMDRLNAARLRDGLPPLTMGRMGRLLMATPTEDLYYLKTVCDQSRDFSKKFWWEVNPKNHTPEAKAAAEKRFAANKKRYER
jgi:hypothetical protein